jgi:hypothetical protein
LFVFSLCGGPIFGIVWLRWRRDASDRPSAGVKLEALLPHKTFTAKDTEASGGRFPRRLFLVYEDAHTRKCLADALDLRTKARDVAEVLEGARTVVFLQMSGDYGTKWIPLARPDRNVSARSCDLDMCFVEIKNPSHRQVVRPRITWGMGMTDEQEIKADRDHEINLALNKALEGLLGEE